MTGIYSILNTVSRKRYIGQSIDIERRIVEHRRQLNKGIHSCMHLQNSFAKHGEEFFEYKVLEECFCGVLTKREQYWMDFFQPKKLFNFAPAAGSNAGIKWGAETRKKMSKAKKGRTLSLAHKAKIAASLIGNTRTKGHSLSDKHKAKIQAALIGRIITEDARRRTSEKLKGHIVSQATREKLSIAGIGRKHSKEAKIKIGIASKQRHNNLKHKKEKCHDNS